MSITEVSYHLPLRPFCFTLSRPALTSGNWINPVEDPCADQAERRAHTVPGFFNPSYQTLRK